MIFSENKLFSCTYENEEATHRLFCFPSAGGDANMFRDWYQYLPEAEVWGVTFPGRGVLSQKPFVNDFGELVRLLLSELKQFNDKPFIFFGHSFGALISYALAVELDNGSSNLQAMMVCARRAPQVEDAHGFSTMSNEEVLNKLMSLNSIPLAIAESKEMLEYYLSVIINDLTLNETVLNVSEPTLDLPTYIYSGKSDDFVRHQEMDGWQKISTGPEIIREFNGDHFFIVNNKEEFLDQFSEDVEFIQGIDDDQVAY